MPQIRLGAIGYKMYQPACRDQNRRKTRTEHAEDIQYQVLSIFRCHELRTEEDMAVSSGRGRRRQQSVHFAQWIFTEKSFYFCVLSTDELHQGSMRKCLGSIRGDDATLCSQFYA